MTTITSFLLSTIHIGWQRFSLFNNDMFNIKNIYYGTLNNHPVIFKKMAHQSEWIMFDDCRQHKTSCSHQFKSSLTTLLPCSNTTFISKFRNAYVTLIFFYSKRFHTWIDLFVQLAWICTKVKYHYQQLFKLMLNLLYYQ